MIPLSLVNVSNLGLNDGLNPGPEPGADVPDLVLQQALQDLGDGDPQGIGIVMFGVIDLTIKISPNWKIQYIEVWGARRPEVFGPEIIVVAGPVLDEVGHVTGHPVLHQDGLRIVYKVGLDPKDVVGLQHPLQVALSPKLRLISRSPEADWQGVWRQPV